MSKNKNGIMLDVPVKTKNEISIAYNKPFFSDSGVDTNRGFIEKDFSKLSLIREVKKKLSGNSKDTGDYFSLDELYINKKNRYVINHFLEDYKESLKIERKCPILVLEGHKGLGRECIARAIALSQGKTITIQNNESINNQDNELLYYIQSDISKEELEELIQKNHCIVLSGELSGNGVIDSLAVYKVKLSVDEYLSEQAFEMILKTIAQRHKMGDLRVSLKLYLRLGKDVTPREIVDLLEEHIVIAKRNKVSDISDYISQVINEMIREELEKGKSYGLTYPEKKLIDVSFDKNINDSLNSIIEYTKNMQNNDLKFIKKLNGHKKCICLFHGESGTGKSLCAEVIASEANKGLWRIDLGQIRSKFVGESEKILTSVFKKAEILGVVLQLDECDGLFSNRENLGQNADYKVDIINHLLNLVENYKGVLILTSNLIQRIDPAFSRRINYKIEFMSPSNEIAQSILKKMLEPDAPLAENFSFENVLHGISTTGGLLKLAVERIALKLIVSDCGVISEEMMRDSILEIIDESFGENQFRRERIGLIA